MTSSGTRELRLVSSNWPCSYWDSWPRIIQGITLIFAVHQLYIANFVRQIHLEANYKSQASVTNNSHKVSPVFINRQSSSTFISTLTNPWRARCRLAGEYKRGALNSGVHEPSLLKIHEPRISTSQASQSLFSQGSSFRIEPYIIYILLWSLTSVILSGSIVELSPVLV